MNNNEIEEALDKLDRDYFHIIREMDGTGKIKDWSVYYRNMKDSDYFNDDNKAILSSNKDGIKEIMNVVNEFELVKTKAKIETVNEQFMQFNNVFEYSNKMLNVINTSTILIGISILILLILKNIFLGSDIFISIFLFCISSIALLIHAYIFDNILDGLYKLEDKETEVLIKNELKYRKENLYEFKKKNRKRSTKKDETK